jgi:phosphoribosylformylglycinamidine synthase
MKAYVYVSLKKSVLDPQGKTIQGALRKMGYKGLAREVLTNPVIEEFRFSLEE